MKKVIFAVGTLLVLLTFAFAQQTPRPVLENQLILIEDSLQENEQRQEDYRNQDREVPEFLINQREKIESEKQQVEQDLKR